MSSQNNRTTVDSRQDYMYVDHNRQETAEQIEQILNYYRRDLKQEPNTQLDYHRQLITRLVDLIRPAYPSQQRKMNELDMLIEDIGVSHDKRYIDQKEKIEQLQSEICHLKKLIITSNGDENGNSSMISLHRMNSMIDYEEWMEMDEETRKLHNIIESQSDRLNELIQLIAQEGTSQLQRCASNTTIPSTDQSSTGKQQSTASNGNAGSTPVTRIPASPGSQPNSGTGTSRELTNELPSSGTSPFTSLINSITNPDDETRTDDRDTIIDIPHRPLTRIASYNDIEQCPICAYRFPITFTELEIINHLQKCSSPRLPIETNTYKCPSCNQNVPDVDDRTYIQHVTECFAIGHE